METRRRGGQGNNKMAALAIKPAMSALGIKQARKEVSVISPNKQSCKNS